MGTGRQYDEEFKKQAIIQTIYYCNYSVPPKFLMKNTVFLA